MIILHTFTKVHIPVKKSPKKDTFLRQESQFRTDNKIIQSYIKMTFLREH